MEAWNNRESDELSPLHSVNQALYNDRCKQYGDITDKNVNGNVIYVTTGTPSVDGTRDQMAPLECADILFICI